MKHSSFLLKRFMNRFTYLVKSKYHCGLEKSMLFAGKIIASQRFWQNVQGNGADVVNFDRVKQREKAE